LGAAAADEAAVEAVDEAGAVDAALVNFDELHPAANSRPVAASRPKTRLRGRTRLLQVVWS
jgi:hypothetical protein